MNVERHPRRRISIIVVGAGALALTMALVNAQQPATDTRDPRQAQDAGYAALYRQWTGDARYGSPLVDHLPVAKGIPTPNDVLGYHIGAPRKLTYHADILKYYRALAKATPRVQIEPIGRTDEGRELVVVWVSSEQNMKGLQANRDRLAKLADPRGRSEAEIRQLIAATKPAYHIIGGLHSGETGPSEALMELVYRLAVETSPIISSIRNNVYVSVTPVADPDGRDRYLDWFYRGLEMADAAGAAAAATAQASDQGGGQRAAQPEGQGAGQRAGEGQAPAGGQRGGAGAAMGVPYTSKYVGHDNNRDINLSLVQVRALTEWFYTAHPPIMHDLHESLALMYTYSGGPPQNPNLDPLLFAELPWFSNWEMAQMTKWGMPGVYTHGFMDGWSPGYYASVAYNHNAVMRMYETQSGRDPAAPPAAPAPRGGGPDPAAAAQAGGRRGEAPQAAARGGTPAEAQRGGAPGEGMRAASAIPTGRGGTQEREWYRGIPVPPNAAASFSRRANANYMQTGLISALQLTAQFPATIVENFSVKARNAIEEGRTRAPFGFVIPAQRDMTRVAELLRILRVQGIEIGQASAEFTLGEATYPAGSYVIKRDQPYGRLAKNLLEKQVFPDTRLTTYDDSGWTMGLLMAVDVKEIADAAVLKVPVTPVTKVAVHGRVSGGGTAGLAVAHYGSNNMIAFRYKLRSTAMKIAETAFTSEGVEFPAGSFVIAGPPTAEARAAVADLGLTAAALAAVPDVPMHDAPAPRIAVYSQWTGTQDLGWYRLTFDNLAVPYDLIYKERVVKGDLRRQYDVILMAAQNITRAAVMQLPAARPQPYQKSEKYKSLGMYGETPDMSGGFGQAGVDAFAKFLEEGGVLIAAGAAVRFPIEFGWAHTVDAEPITGVTAQRPVIQAELVRPDHPAFYGYTERTIPIKYQGGVTLRVGVANQGNLLARYAGGDSSVLTGSMVGADQLRQKAFAVDIPGACGGKGRVILFALPPQNLWVKV